MPTSIVILAWLHLAGMGEMKDGFILNALGVVLLMTALAMTFKNRTHALGQRSLGTAPERFKSARCCAGLKRRLEMPTRVGHASCLEMLFAKSPKAQ